MAKIIDQSYDIPLLLERNAKAVIRLTIYADPKKQTHSALPIAAAFDEMSNTLLSALYLASVPPADKPKE